MFSLFQRRAGNKGSINLELALLLLLLVLACVWGLRFMGLGIANVFNRAAGSFSVAGGISVYRGDGYIEVSGYVPEGSNPPASYQFYWSTNPTAPIATTTPSRSGVTSDTTVISGISNTTDYYIWERPVAQDGTKGTWSSAIVSVAPPVNYIAVSSTSLGGGAYASTVVTDTTGAYSFPEAAGGYRLRVTKVFADGTKQVLAFSPSDFNTGSYMPGQYTGTSSLALPTVTFAPGDKVLLDVVRGYGESGGNVWTGNGTGNLIWAPFYSSTSPAFTETTTWKQQTLTYQYGYWTSMVGYYCNGMKVGANLTKLKILQMPPSPGDDLQPPSEVTGLTAASGDYRVVLSGYSATDNVGVASYDIYQSLNSTPPDANTYPSATSLNGNLTRSGLINGSPYYFWLRAVDAAGNRGPWMSSPVVCTPNPAPTLERYYLLGDTQKIDTVDNTSNLNIGIDGNNSNGFRVKLYRLNADSSKDLLATSANLNFSSYSPGTYGGTVSLPIAATTFNTGDGWELDVEESVSGIWTVRRLGPQNTPYNAPRTIKAQTVTFRYAYKTSMLVPGNYLRLGFRQTYFDIDTTP